jgi:DNA mismatch repair protein PMS2
MLKTLTTKDCQRICAEQVITDLPCIVKELIDNALDADSSNIHIILRNKGLDGVEVRDDGGGLTLEELRRLARQGTTSKTETFDDVYSGKTLGFRGEALWAIRQLTSLEIRSRKADFPTGFSVKYEEDLQETSIAREPGTSVLVSSAFTGLPIRREELNRTGASVLSKVIQMVQAFAIVFTGTRFVLTHETSK